MTGVDDDHGRTRLVAYLVGDDTAGDRLDADAVLAGAADRLAGHMIPHSAMVLDELPVTPGGKLDRRALPVPEFTTPADGYVAPATTAEETLAAIVAGLGSYPFTVIAALLVGVVESFASFWASAYKEVLVFTIIIPFLLFRSLGGHGAEEEE